ncbi:MAG: EI24 domain-containing protein [Planctomycetes bacterium]|nr:EI24 domain-containing protein [Planctomycetota bacterium]
MIPIPCRTCGYHSTSEDCPLCSQRPREASLLAPRARGIARFGEGFRALGHGLRLLATTPRTKRLLVPPFVLTSAVFVLVFAWAWSWISGVLGALDEDLEAKLAQLPALLKPVVGWLLHTGALLVSARLLAFLVLALTASLVFLWCFSVVYEALCGPFLDSVQARIEARWFGRDPRAVLEDAGARPTFARRVGRELSTWFTSIKASLLALFVLIAFVWVKFIPLLGVPIFAVVAGFATALTLLDIPFSRRRWTLRQRLRFLSSNLPEWISLGIASGLCFVLPFIGPLVGVPVASIGGLWLFVRLDKAPLRAPTRSARA